ncbi:MAG: hypothetical protein DRH04_01935 [Deltaproteobacteria bacterium]|nr:MAG: hypothetical protein DRH04_01935 [Deltaproteobacteria bacterium]
MHAAKIDSPRLQRVLSLLRMRGWYTTWEIMKRARVCAVNTAISELRANGYDIECKRFGQNLYAYRLKREEVNQSEHI